MNTTGSLNQYTSFKGKTLDHAFNGNTIIDVSELCTPSAPPPSQSSSMTQTGSHSSASSSQSLPPPSDTQVRYEYDGLNRLRRVLCVDTQTQTSHALGIYFYDASGRRIFRKASEDHDENTGPGGLEVSVRYVFDGDREVEERDGAGSLLREFVFGNYIDEPLWMRTYSGSNAGEYLFAQDENFNVYALMAGGFGFGASSNVTGTIVEQYRYDAYGSFQRYTPSAPGVGPWTESGARNTKSLFDNPWLYQGRRFDVESNLFFFRARYFNPLTGRFISFDPLGYQGGSLNLFGFLQSTPLGLLDPYGKSATAKAAGVIAMGGAAAVSTGFFVLASPLILGATVFAAGAYFGLALGGIGADLVGQATGWDTRENQQSALWGMEKLRDYVFEPLINGTIDLFNPKSWIDDFAGFQVACEGEDVGDAAIRGGKIGFKIGAVASMIFGPKAEIGRLRSGSRAGYGDVKAALKLRNSVITQQRATGSTPVELNRAYLDVRPKSLQSRFEFEYQANGNVKVTRWDAVGNEPWRAPTTREVPYSKDPEFFQGIGLEQKVGAKVPTGTGPAEPQGGIEWKRPYGFPFPGGKNDR